MNEPRILGRKIVPLSSLKLWDKNPKIHTKDGLARLEKQIRELGDYKDLLVNEDMIILGGNGRTKVYRQMGKREVGVIIVEARDEATMLKYALSDNDGVGEYDKQALAEYVTSLDIPMIEFEPFEIDLGKSIPITDIVMEFGPDFDDHEKKSRRPKEVSCPHCGEMFEI